MSDEQTLRCEGVGLDIDICSCYTFQETGFSNIRISANEKSSGVWVDRGETAEMLPNLIEVEEGIFQSSANGGHSTQCSTFQLLALEKGLRIFEKSDIITGNNLD